jgi:hypothetical protein
MPLGCEAIGLLHPDNIKCDEEVSNKKGTQVPG